MGPRRHGDFQLDRINTHDKRYGPGLCRWADSVQQSNNRRTTIVLTHPETSPVPLTEVAKHLGMKTDTLRKQVREGRPLPEAKSLRTWFRSTRTPESGGLGLWRMKHTPHGMNGFGSTESYGHPRPAKATNGVLSLPAGSCRTLW
jgi:hypothetical protein